jgi:hypothetical protein
VYAFDETGVVPVREGYRHLVRTLDLDAIVLVDGGTDVLMRGDEQAPARKRPRMLIPHRARARAVESHDFPLPRGDLG